MSEISMINIKFKQIDITNYQKCIDLKLSEEQNKFVASNMFSLVQAAYEPNLYPVGVYPMTTIRKLPSSTKWEYNGCYVSG